MNILYVVPYVPNLIRVRPYNLIRYLSERGHRVSVATIWSNEKEQESLGHLKHQCYQVHDIHLPGWRSLWNCVAALPSRDPLQSIYSWKPALAQEMLELTSGANGKPGFDVVHVEHLRGARYGIYLKSAFVRRKMRVPVVWDSVDSISLLFRQAMVQSKSSFSRGLTRFELGRTERYERWLLSQFERVLVTSPKDKQAFLSLAGPGNPPPSIEVLRNGVDLAYFRPDNNLGRDPATLVLSGKMSYHANITMVLHFIENIMPHVWARRPDVQVCIVGKDPPKKIQALSQNPNIHVTGTVSDIRPYLQKATAAVAPIAYGAGIQNKVLEAMACGTPVVATSQAVSALEVEPGKDILVADEPAGFAAAVLELIHQPRLQEKIGQSGRRYVETYHDWAATAAQLEEVYRQVTR